MLAQFTILGNISLINFVTCVFIGTFLLVKNQKSQVNLAYCIFDFCIAFYAFFYFLWQSSTDPRWGVIFFKWCIFGVVLINSAFVQFTYVILDLERRYKHQLVFVHALNLFFCYGSLFLFYNDWKIKYTYGLWPIPSTIFHFYILWWFTQVLTCFFLLYHQGIERSEGKQKKQFQWIFWSTLIAYAGGATNWLVWYDINFPPYLNSGIAVYALVLAYAIFRHKLLGIDVIIKKTLVFAGLLAFVFGVFSAAAFFVREILSFYFHVGNLLTYTISLFLIVLGYDPIRNLLINLTDRYLFQKKYDYQKILKDASRGMSRIESLHRLLGLVVHFVTMRMRIKNAAVLMRRQGVGRFEFKYQRGYAKYYLEYALEDYDPLIQYLSAEKEAIDLERVKEYIEGGNKKKAKGQPPREYDFKSILNTMQELEAA